MAKASSFQWRYLVSLIQAVPLSDLAETALKQRSVRRWMGSHRGWLLIATGTASLLYWNGRLVVSTGAGIGVMMLLYLLHDWKLDIPWSQIRKVLTGWNQPIVLAIAGGGLASFTTYFATSIWIDSESPWIASGAILQGLGTLTVLVLLIWQNLNRQATREQVHFNQMLADLTHTDPLKRLIAVRQLTHIVPDLHKHPTRSREIADYFRLLLNREEELIVREAALEGLQQLDRTKQLKQAMQPLLNTTALKQSSLKSRSRVPIE